MDVRGSAGKGKCIWRSRTIPGTIRNIFSDGCIQASSDDQVQSVSSEK